MKITRYAVLILMLTILAGTVLLMVSKAPGLSSAYSPPTFATPINLSNDLTNSSSSGNATDPDVVSVGSHVYAAWGEFSRGVLFRESPDSGVTWNPPVNQSGRDIAFAGRVSAPQISANGSNVYVVWSQTIGTTGAQIVEATSTNYGASFGTPVQITSGTGPYITPSIASWGSNVAVVYTASNMSYVTVSTNNGSTWSSPHMYASNHQPHVAMWQNNVYAIADPITFAVSHDLGATWNVSTLSPAGADPSIAAYANNVYVAWETKGSSSVVYALVSDNYGANYTIKSVSGTLPGSWGPAVGAYGSSMWVALHTTPGGNRSQVFVLASTNNASSWGSPVSLTGSLSGDNATTGAPFEVVTSDGANVYVSWSQQLDTSTFELKASYSGNGGTTWTAAPGIDVSQNPSGTQASNLNVVPTAAIASSGADVFAVWQYSNSSTPGVNQVYFTSYVVPVSTTSTSSSSGGSTTNSTTTTVSTSTTSGTGTATTSTSTTTGSASVSTTTSSSSTTGVSSTSPLLLYAAVIAAIIIIVAVVAAIFIRRARR